MREPRLPAAQESVRRLEAMNNTPAFACILSILEANLKFSIQVELRTIRVGVMTLHTLLEACQFTQRKFSVNLQCSLELLLSYSPVYFLNTLSRLQ